MRRKAVMQKKEIEFLFSTVEERRLDIEQKLNEAGIVIKDMSQTAEIKDQMNNDALEELYTEIEGLKVKSHQLES